jgi:hypothetical protein
LLRMANFMAAMAGEICKNLQMRVRNFESIIVYEEQTT